MIQFADENRRSILPGKSGSVCEMKIGYWFFRKGSRSRWWSRLHFQNRDPIAKRCSFEIITIRYNDSGIPTCLIPSGMRQVRIRQDRQLRTGRNGGRSFLIMFSTEWKNFIAINIGTEPLIRITHILIFYFSVRPKKNIFSRLWLKKFNRFWSFMTVMEPFRLND